MKIKIALIYFLSVIAFVAVGQDIENDDMYFNSKDREKLNVLRAGETASYASAKKTDTNERRDEQYAEEDLNPTDSYSARNVNPEFEARSNAQNVQHDNEDYFVNDYQYNTASNFNNFNNNFSRWYTNPWYTSSWFGPSINSWNSPYYGYNDPYYSPWYDPYWNYNGWSASFSYHWGNSWNYGWGGNYNYWNRPYGAWGWGSSFGPSWGWGSNWYGYPGRVIVVNNNYGEDGGRRVTHGRRATRGTTTVNPTQINNSRTRSESNVSTSGGRNNGSTGGRTRAANRQEEYYNRSWKYTAPANSNTNSNTRTRSSYNNDSWGNQNNNSWNNNNNNSQNQSRPSYNQGRSDSYNSGTRQHSSGSSSGSNGRTRGRD